MTAEHNPWVDRLLARLTPDPKRHVASWANLFEQFNFPPREFYSLVERNLGARELDRTKLDLAVLRERGIFSANRLYLCVRRERLLFVLCAAPFGTGYLISSRLIDQRRDAGPWEYLAAGLLLCATFAGVFVKLGLVWAVVLTGLVITLSWSLMRLAFAEGFDWFEDQIVTIPVVGHIYETWFNPDTLYRQDQTAGYRQAVHHAVMQSVEEMTKAQGLRPLTDEQKRPQLPPWGNR